MKLEVLHEFTLFKYPGLLFPYQKLFKKQQNPGKPARNADDNTQGSTPQRTGNQNTAVTKPRHRKFFNMPPDGASIESGQAIDPINRPNFRPVPMRFGQNLIPNTIINPLTSEDTVSDEVISEGFATNLALTTIFLLSAMSSGAVIAKLTKFGMTPDQAKMAISMVFNAKSESELNKVNEKMHEMIGEKDQTNDYIDRIDLLHSYMHDVGFLRDKFRENEKETLNNIILLLNYDEALNQKIYENISIFHKAHEGEIDHARAVKELTTVLSDKTIEVAGKSYKAPKITREFISVIIDFWNVIYPKLKNVTNYESEEDWNRRMDYYDRVQRFKEGQLPKTNLKDRLRIRLNNRMRTPGDIT